MHKIRSVVNNSLIACVHLFSSLILTNVNNCHDFWNINAFFKNREKNRQMAASDYTAGNHRPYFMHLKVPYCENRFLLGFVVCIRLDVYNLSWKNIIILAIVSLFPPLPQYGPQK